MTLVPLVAEMFSELITNIVGPLPVITSGSKYLLTAMSVSSKYPDTVALWKEKKENHVLEYVLNPMKEISETCQQKYEREQDIILKAKIYKMFQMKTIEVFEKVILHRYGSLPKHLERNPDDYRMLKEITKTQHFPKPNIEE
ncbi:hypothetical protein NPIL_629791 [Nephila pilipes]|uniref:Uncharacterized protein n=1 Tax=Nephila pilipes TaxID=299642 RepID=A0A8X6QCW8_NEPPI|nr:hypothetical protein NPIL_629791 [Nephila pilipes]